VAVSGEEDARFDSPARVAIDAGPVDVEVAGDVFRQTLGS
jgi:hypothetical protein